MGGAHTHRVGYKMGLARDKVGWGRCTVEVLGEDKAGRRWSHVVAQKLSLSVGGQPSLSPGGGAWAAGLGGCLFLQFLLS